MRAKTIVWLPAALLCLTSRLFAGEFHAEKLAEMDAAINDAIAHHKCPGGVLWLEHDNAIYKKAYGDSDSDRLQKEPFTTHCCERLYKWSGRELNPRPLHCERK